MRTSVCGGHAAAASAVIAAIGRVETVGSRLLACAGDVMRVLRVRSHPVVPARVRFHTLVQESSRGETGCNSLAYGWRLQSPGWVSHGDYGGATGCSQLGHSMKTRCSLSTS